MAAKVLKLIALVIVEALAIWSLTWIVPRSCWTACAPHRANATRALMGQVAGAIDLFMLDQGRYPERLEDLVERPAYATRWTQPYLKRIPVDGWGRAFLYRRDGRTYVLGSLGADGAEGGAGFDEDLWLPELRRATSSTSHP